MERHSGSARMVHGEGQEAVDKLELSVRAAGRTACAWTNEWTNVHLSRERPCQRNPREAF